MNWEAKLRKHIDNLFIPKTVKNIDEKSYITYESEPEKITSEERAKVQKGAVTINNIQIENKNFDVNILSKLLDKVTKSPFKNRVCLKGLFVKSGVKRFLTQL